MGYDNQRVGTGVNQHCKQGGDAMGVAGAGAGADAGYGYGRGDAAVWNVDPIGTGVGVGGNAGAHAGAAGAVGGDATDNTSIGSINISS